MRYKLGKSRYIFNGYARIGKRPIDDGPIFFISIFAREIKTILSIQAFGCWFEVYYY